MKCVIADLLIEIPEAGGMAPRCQDYLTDSDLPADIVISQEEYQDLPIYGQRSDVKCYTESAGLFYMNLLRFDGMMLHASAAVLDGKAYLFSGDSGVGKSTHTQLWQQTFENVDVINDDKPALRLVDGHWYAYGTPWCGKAGINQNKKALVAGICFLRQGKENRIRRLEPEEAIPLIYRQTIHRLVKRENTVRLLSHMDKLVRMIPVYELTNRPEPAAAILSLETMRSGAEAAGL
jgi:hypothetical protein